MITLDTPDVLALPNVSVYEYTELPNQQGLYFVMDRNRHVYIGKSQNSMSSRWVAHHRLEEVLSLEKARIYFLVTNLSTDQLSSFEANAIKNLHPELNFTKPPDGNSTNLEALKLRAKKFRELQFYTRYQLFIESIEPSPTPKEIHNLIVTDNKRCLAEIQKEFKFTVSQQAE